MTTVTPSLELSALLFRPACFFPYCRLDVLSAMSLMSGLQSNTGVPPRLSPQCLSRRQLHLVHSPSPRPRDRARKTRPQAEKISQYVPPYLYSSRSKGRARCGSSAYTSVADACDARSPLARYDTCHHHTYYTYRYVLVQCDGYAPT